MRCRNCGWDNPDNNTVCEKCGAPLNNAGVGAVQNGGNNSYSNSVAETLREDVAFGPVPPTVPEAVPSQPTPQSQGGGMYGGTVPPWMQMTTMGYCKLTPMPNMPNEKHMPAEAELKGDVIELNRETIDPDNNTISQKAQAILTFENGQWYIQDKSAYQTTYIYAGEKKPVKTGDVILMGSRRFVFTEE